MTDMPDPMLQYLRYAAARLSAELPPGYTATWDDTPLVVNKSVGYMTVSDELLMDYGVIPDTRPPVHIPWYRRLRWRLSAWRERAGRKVGGWIAGVDLDERDDW